MIKDDFRLLSREMQFNIHSFLNYTDCSIFFQTLQIYFTGKRKRENQTWAYNKCIFSTNNDKHTDKLFHRA